MPSVEALEARMLTFVWQGRHHELKELGGDSDEDDQGEGWVDRDAEKERQLRDYEDEEHLIGAVPGSWEARDKRPMMLYAPLVSGLAIILCFVFIGSGMRNLVKECLLDGSYTRFALLCTAPLGYLLGIVSDRIHI